MKKLFHFCFLILLIANGETKRQPPEIIKMRGRYLFWGLEELVSVEETLLVGVGLVVGVIDGEVILIGSIMAEAVADSSGVYLP